MAHITVRGAANGDISGIVGLIGELEAGDGAPISATPDRLRADLLDDSSPAHAIVAEVDGVVVGYAIWNLTYSSRLAQYRIYMSDLCVTESWRECGVGRALMANLAARCLEHGYERIEWRALSENPAVSFYERLGGQVRGGRLQFISTPEMLRNLADLT